VYFYLETTYSKLSVRMSYCFPLVGIGGRIDA
jgi:hypothetical protein